MEIVVNTRLLIRNRLEGIGWFTFESLKRITRDHPEHHFIFAFDREFDEEFILADNVTPIILSPQARHPFLYYIWFEFSIAHLLKDMKPDLFLSTDGYLSLKTDTKQLAVIHDINFRHHPEDLPFLERKYYNYFFPKYAHKATRLATVSQYSKNDIVKEFRVDPSKIDVVYDGVNEHFGPVGLLERQAVKEKYANGSDYFVFVGALHPRKNIGRLLQAFDEFKKAYSSQVKLVIVGKKMWWTDEIENTYEAMRHKSDVVFTGRLSSEELNRVIASSLALTYVTYFEGFGIPILEGFRCETAVITSNITSMPEVAGDAALLVDPFSVESIKGAMLLLAKDEPLRQSFIEKGKIRRHQFSWDKTAKLLWESIEKAAG
ncbi:MAG: glycosyltransferase family 4 protein [Bacteroidia bacterium]|nr:glycosyltransferase family 4 protein [Bacteroidia bacterium]